MLVTISPAKTLDFEPQDVPESPTMPAFLKQSRQLNKRLRQLKPDDLSALMGISEKLVEDAIHNG